MLTVILIWIQCCTNLFHWSLLFTPEANIGKGLPTEYKAESTFAGCCILVLGLRSIGKEHLIGKKIRSKIMASSNSSGKIKLCTMCNTSISWWRHQMETFSALLAICAGNSPSHQCCGVNSATPKQTWFSCLDFTHCGLVTLYDNIDLGQHGVR